MGSMIQSLEDQIVFMLRQELCWSDIQCLDWRKGDA